MVHSNSATFPHRKLTVSPSNQKMAEAGSPRSDSGQLADLEENDNEKEEKQTEEVTSASQEAETPEGRLKETGQAVFVSEPASQEVETSQESTVETGQAVFVSELALQEVETSRGSTVETGQAASVSELALQEVETSRGSTIETGQAVSVSKLTALEEVQDETLPLEPQGSISISQSFDTEESVAVPDRAVSHLLRRTNTLRLTQSDLTAPHGESGITEPQVQQLSLWLLKWKQLQPKYSVCP
nr:PREDICTED: uncharacterized protein LOC106702378 [Latimeria chalumnae]|eukprot:XP_014340011.1 PREDICTED: uncharacterized protein LOC106702378 [Latimeria chalumnae]